MDDGVCPLIMFYTCTNISIGIMIGWAVSLFTTCGTFDTQNYINDIMKGANCTRPANSDKCRNIEHDAFIDATDQSFRMCFYYCSWGIYIALIFTIVTLLIVRIIQKQLKIKKQCQSALDIITLYCSKCWKTVLFGFSRCKEMFTNSRDNLDHLRTPLFQFLTPLPPLSLPPPLMLSPPPPPLMLSPHQLQNQTVELSPYQRPPSPLSLLLPSAQSLLLPLPLLLSPSQPPYQTVESSRSLLFSPLNIHPKHVLVDGDSHPESPLTPRISPLLFYNTEYLS